MSNPYHQPDPYQSQPPYPAGSPGYGYPQSAPQDGQFGTPQAQPPASAAYPQAPGYGYPQGQPPYGTYPPGTVAGAAVEQNNLATISVVLGFLSVVGSFICYLGVIAPVGIGFGVAALRRAQQTGVGRNTAIGGLVLSFLGLIITSVIIFFFIDLANSAP